MCYNSIIKIILGKKMKLISLKCPNCNSNIYIDDDKDRCFCSHCGAQILLDNPNDKKITYTTIDVARIKEAETYADIRKRELDLEKERLDREAKRERSRSIAKIITILIALLAVIGVVIYAINFIRVNFGDYLGEVLWAIGIGIFALVALWIVQER